MHSDDPQPGRQREPERLSSDVVESTPREGDAAHHVASKQPRAPRLRWARLGHALGEIAIVTVGILIAFALNAWWENRATANREQVHLRALISDFERNVSALRSLIELEEDVMSSAQELLTLARASGPSEKKSVFDLMNRVFNSSRYEPVMGAYEALINSGGLMLIRDESLRAALAEFAAQVNNQYTEDWSNEHYFAFAREFAGTYMLQGWEAQTEAANDERPLQEMLANPRFQGHLVLRYYGERDMLQKYRALLRQAESVLTHLRAHLAS
jgi:Family of unknown function (DUF6090)